MHFLHTILLICLLIVGSTTWAQHVYESIDYAHATSTDKVGMHCKLTFLAGSGKYNPTLQGTPRAVSLFSGNQLVIESLSNKCITKVVLHSAERNKQFKPYHFAASSGCFIVEDQAWSGQNRKMNLTNIAGEGMKIVRIEVYLDDLLPKQTTSMHFNETSFDIFEGFQLPTPILQGVTNEAAKEKLLYLSDDKNVLDCKADGSEVRTVSTGETILSVIYQGDELHAPCMASCIVRSWKDIREIASIGNFNILADEAHTSKLALKAAEVVHVKGKTAFINDDSGCLALHFPNTHPLKAGDILTGFILGKYVRNSYPGLVVENNALSHVKIEHKTVLSPLEVTGDKLALKNCVYGHMVNVIAKIKQGKHKILRLSTNEQDLKIEDILNVKPTLPKNNGCLGLTGLFYCYDNGTILFTPLQKNCIYNELVLDEYKPVNTIVYTPNTTVIVKRKLKAGRWNSICLPVDMEQNELKLIFGEHRLVQFSSVKDNKLHFKTALNLVAGMPYLLKTDSDINSWTLHNVNMDAINAKEITIQGVAFCGTFNVKELLNDGSEQFLSNNKLFIPANNTRLMPGLRAFFRFTTAAGAKQYDYVIDETTDAKLPTTNQYKETNELWFTLDGKPIKPEQRQRGQVYIKQNKKIIMPLRF